MDRQDCKILILLLCTWLTACVRDKPVAYTPAHGTNGNVLIACEGSLGNSNATLYSYNTTTDSVFGDLYTAANGQPLGDVFQSITRIGDSLYLCINNADKIVVINAADYKLAGVISIPKPRYILPVNPGRAYVSSLYGNTLYAINPQSLQVIGTATLPYYNPEGMCIAGGNIIVCPWDTACNKAYSINPLTGSIVGTIQLAGYAPHAALTDKEQMLWVFAGNTVKGRDATLTRIDPSTGASIRTYTFATGADPIKPVFNPTRDTLYFIQVKYDGSTAQNGIYRMAIHDAALPATPFVTAAQYQYFWALGIAPATGYIYIGDPKGFMQKGAVSVYTPTGTLLKTFDVGLGPGQFYFGN